MDYIRLKLFENITGVWFLNHSVYDDFINQDEDIKFLNGLLIHQCGC